MSNLKWLNEAELQQAKAECEKYIDTLSSRISGQRERLKWINIYLEKKTPQAQSTQRKENTMNKSTLALIVSDKVRPVAVMFSSSDNRMYTFKTNDSTIAVDDIVVVESDRGVGYAIAKVVAVDDDANVEYNSDIEYKWVVQKVDTSLLSKTKDTEGKLMDNVKKLEREHRRKQLLAALTNQGGDEVKLLTSEEF